MKTYLSMGMGVNSVAMMLMLLDQGEGFEAIFVDHETDYPETYEYLDMFQGWLAEHGHSKITVLKPKEKDMSNLYDYFYSYSMVPSGFHRICTAKFKVKPIHEYIETPCFMLIGIDWGEAKRAKIATEKGVENRYPLIESEIDRQGCKDIIAAHNLPIPIKSGCFICPFQKRQQWIELRKNHPELRNKEYRISKGKKPMTLSPTKKSLSSIVDENQMNLFEEDDYPPCNCLL